MSSDTGVKGGGTDNPIQLNQMDACTYHFEPPDFFILYMRGDPQKKDIEEMFAGMRTVGRPLYVLANLKDLKNISPEVRKAALDVETKEKDRFRMAAIAVINASWTVRTIVVLVRKAYLFFYPKDAAAFSFFDTEEQARAWLIAQREQALKKNTGPDSNAH